MKDKEDRTAGEIREQRTSDYRKIIEKSKASIDSDSNWLITMSDVMSLLLVFFIMFFFMTRAAEKDKRHHESGTSNMALPAIVLKPIPANTAERIKGEMESVIKELDMEDDVSVHAIDKEIVITMKETVTFRPAEAEILKGSEPILEKIANIIDKYPSFVVEIDGHTDSIPINTPRYSSNWELSVARAISVLKYFTNRHNINPSKFYIKGNADQRPITTNDTPEQRSQNRRVEIRLKKAGSSSDRT
ncbi:MAG: flagellar motor protein MotS [Thermodesulfovibrionales bacterium]